MKRRITALLCVCLLICALVPMSAAADNAIEKVLCTTSYIPVAQADSRDIYVSTSTAGCYVADYGWTDTVTGYNIYQLFTTHNARIDITLIASDGWYFSDSVAAYLNNSSVDCYIADDNHTPLGALADYIATNWQKLKKLGRTDVLKKFYSKEI